ncbi:IS110 family transposase [Streptomyces spinoverrucosus]|uniref:IS110 family transposase n=1 Tax=Streptomyces spinoverrucosus TaxID=284043 RepID=UPI0018C43C46|nr:IS110 family transposase [Streptomyces spinoverrucosus]MBG0852992.1 IS110 family transposase [Streptomyces spinoverrucosus]MBG0853248.1 IS110 family transposase [Streptomyces spinoverrucosus]MBG0853811.1 IS110 family transposase [Streptomyces spinoverrucosus]MBG0855683.1 IS110 family transposase [Streptomyces spinoverrucosus]MBG0855684.1 IS110 family transposase [Streptomyces spinoverrucosus]
MDVLHERCAGVDISKKDAKVCVRTPTAKRRGSFTTETTTWGSTTNAVLALRDHLLAAEVTLVVIEATSDYWKPFYYLLSEDLAVILVNARQVKNLPGRKTDVSDAAWLAQLGAHGLVRPSFVPDQPVRELRDLTRARTQLTRERGQIVQRLEKLLEDTGIKLAAVASDIMGVSGRAMLEALVSGEREPQTLAELAKRKLRNKIPELTEALTGRFRDHHAFLVRLHLDHYDQLTDAVGQLDARIEEAMAPFRGALDLLDTIPGINRAVAEVIVAETGGDMARFASARHLASWAGVCPGHHESAGRTKNTKVRPGNPYLKGALGLAAFGAVRTKDTYLQARYKRLTARRGPLRALVAVEHSIITAIWHMLTDHVTYRELGGAYFTQRDPERATRRAINALNQLGYTVTLNPLGTTA